MKTIAKAFAKLFTVINVLIYIFIFTCLIISLWNPGILKNFDLQWWTTFLILEVWFNVVIMRKKELEDRATKDC